MEYLTKEMIVDATKNTETASEAAAYLNVSFTTFKKYARKHNMYTPATRTEISKRGGLHGGSKPIPLKEILEGKHPSYPTSHLSRRIKDENILTHKCVECGVEDEYNGKKITLDLDHVNGIRNDHRLENLRFLCPNCHSQTITYKSKNIKK